MWHIRLDRNKIEIDWTQTSKRMYLQLIRQAVIIQFWNIVLAFIATSQYVTTP